MERNRVITTKKFFKFASIKSVKTACVCIVFLFIISNIMIKTSILRTTMLHLIAKVEKKE